MPTPNPTRTRTPTPVPPITATTTTASTHSSSTNTTRTTPLRTTPLLIRTTPPIRQSFPLPLHSTNHFTGSLFDSIVIFLQKYSIEWHDIKYVSRGTHPSTAVPTICISIASSSSSSPEAEEKDENYNNDKINSITTLWQEYVTSGLGNWKDTIPDEIVEVEFAFVYVDLLPNMHHHLPHPQSTPSGRKNNTHNNNSQPPTTTTTTTTITKFLNQGGSVVGGSIVSMVNASFRNAVNVAGGGGGYRSDLLLPYTLIQQPLSLSKQLSRDNLRDGDWSGVGDDENDQDDGESGGDGDGNVNDGNKSNYDEEQENGEGGIKTNKTSEEGKLG